MALTVTQRPEGYKLGTVANTATAQPLYIGNDVSFFKLAHGLTDGDYIFATSDIENYNGFFYVDSVTGDNFKIKYYETGDYVQYIATGDITYYTSEFSHGWSCVHLPIVYKIQSDLFPVNSVDTARTVSSFTDVNGYTNLNLSGALKGTVVDLDYVKISGSTNEDLNGVWQIIDAVSTSDVTINLAYDAAYSFAGATVQFYYNNYHIRVKVFGGLPTTHTWETLKPFEELAELKIIPDSAGQIMFSIHEILKAQINTRNNLLLATLPLNLDFFTQFYIEYAESYDVSDGSEITAFTDTYQSDNFTDGWVPIVLDAMNLWTETGVGNDWVNTVTPSVTLVDDEDSEYLGDDYAFVVGQTYRFTYNVDTATTGAGAFSSNFVIQVVNASNTVTYFTHTDLIISLHPEGTTASFIAPLGAARIVIRLTQSTSIGTVSNEYTVLSLVLETDESTGFDGYAANTMLPFKNQYSGYLTEYIEGKWLTNFINPVIFDNYFDLSAIVNGSGTLEVLKNGDVYDSFDVDPGIYRIPVTYDGAHATMQLRLDGDDITDEIEVIADTKCSPQSIYLTWLNNLGGFDWWEFKAQSDHLVDITEAGVTTQNIFPSWPQSYSTIADTIRKQTYRRSNKSMVVRSHLVTQDQLDAISYIKSSVLVQIVTSRSDRRTVIVDTDSFTKYKDGDKTYSISLAITFTDDIPSQSV